MRLFDACYLGKTSSLMAVNPKPSDPAIVMYTSGSTGTSPHCQKDSVVRAQFVWKATLQVFIDHIYAYRVVLLQVVWVI